MQRRQGTRRVLATLRRPVSFRGVLIVATSLFVLLLNFSRRSSPHFRRVHRLLGKQSLTPSDVSDPSLTIKWSSSSEGNVREEKGNERRKTGVEGGGKNASSAEKIEGKLSLSVPTVKLSNGVDMPQLGFGTAGLGESTGIAVGWALQAGYRLLDSAQAREWYREDLVGAAIKASGIPREDIFIVSKLHPRHMGYEITKQRFEDSLRDLGTSYVDVFLLHYPWCFPAICGAKQPKGAWSDSWRAMEDMYARGKMRAIGVSNFGREELLELIAQAEVKPHIVQRNSDPLRQDTEVQRVCKEQGIQYMGYSSLGSQWQFHGQDKNPVLTHPLIVQIGMQRSCSAAQVVLKWALSRGQVVIPRSGNKGRISENLESPNCELAEGDLLKIDALDGSMDKASSP